MTVGVALTDLVEGVRADLAAYSGVNVAQGGSSVTEGIHDEYTVQVTPEMGEESHKSGTDRATFGKGTSTERIVLNIDVYARQRSNIGEDMAAVITAADVVRSFLKESITEPLFGVTGVLTLHWTWQRVLFTYNKVEHVGIRFVLTFVCKGV